MNEPKRDNLDYKYGILINFGKQIQIFDVFFWAKGPMS